MVGVAVTHPIATPACPDDFGQGTGYEIFVSSVAEIFGKTGSCHNAPTVVAGVSTLSNGLHRGSDHEVIPSWQACCRCDCRLGGELRGGLLSRNVVRRAYSDHLVFSAVLQPVWVWMGLFPIGLSSRPNPRQRDFYFPAL